MDPVMYDYQTLLIDARYALAQLTGVDDRCLNQAGQYHAQDRVQRARDALERVVERLEQVIAEETAPLDPEREDDIHVNPEDPRW